MNTMMQVNELMLSTQITAVKIQENTVFIGEGQYLYIHSVETGEKLADVRVFKAAAVHGIQIRTSLNGSSAIWKALVWGQKSLRIVLFSPAESKCWLQTEEKNFEDWIVDAAWEDLKHIVVATAHNVLFHLRVIEEPSQRILPLNNLVNCPDGNHLEKFEVLEKEQCSENCILYCGHIVVGAGFYETCVLLAGTVFSQVLIWGPWGMKNQHGRIVPCHCLSGHQGVLFSINFCEKENVITTTSDDRTFRIWKIHFKHGESDCKIQSYWNSCHITEEYKCYGHGSRVWHSLILPFCYISIGEDSKVCVWDYNGVLKLSWQAHDGACIWSVDTSEDGCKIVTGGGDGSVKSWSLRLDGLKSPEVMTKLPWVDNGYELKDGTSDVKFADSSVLDLNPEACNLVGTNLHKGKRDSNCSGKTEDFPRCVAIFGADRYLVILDSGKLYCWSCCISEWFLVYEDKRLKNYSLMESSPDQLMVAIGTLCGNIIILTSDLSDHHVRVVVDEKVVDGKVFAIHWLNSKCFITCGSKGCVVSWILDIYKGTIKKGQTYTLPACKQRWVSAACYFGYQDQRYLICGDRAGSIHLYSENSSESQHSLRSIHGKNGVTSLSNHQGSLYSTGRDGCIRRLTVVDTTLQVITVTRVSSANWIASLINLHGRSLAVCFHDVKLKLWSMEEDRALVDIECGGGHRSWALQCSEERNNLNFIYIKDTKPYTFSSILKDKLMPLIKTPVNTRETMCLEVLIQQDNVTYFATGGEDTTVRLHAINCCKNNQLKTFNVIRSHISNVRAMCSIENTLGYVPRCDKGTSKWLVTAGGRAQLKIWKTLDLHSEDRRKREGYIDICCREVTSYMLRTGSSKTWKSQEITFDPETRYMDATAFWVSEVKAIIVLASSDGFLRFFEFDNQVERLSLVYSQAWDHCLLKLEKLYIQHFCILISAATDGILTFWNIQSIINYIANNTDNIVSYHAPEISKGASIKAHQSGINSIAITSKIGWMSGDFLPDTFIIATGGDDNKIALWQITGHLGEDKLLTLSKRFICDVHGHASQVVGLNWLTPCHLISTSIDQRVTIWKLQQNSSVINSQNSSSTINDVVKSERSQNPLINKDEIKSGSQNPLTDDGLMPLRLEVVSTHFTGVPDVKGLTVSNMGSQLTSQSKDCFEGETVSLKRVFIYGVGLQVYDVEINDT